MFKLLKNFLFFFFFCRMESLVQSQARELCELREQIRVSRTLGAEQRRQLLELRGALEELMQSNDGQSTLSTTLQKHLDWSLSLLDKLEQGEYSNTPKKPPC